MEGDFKGLEDFIQQLGEQLGEQFAGHGALQKLMGGDRGGGGEAFRDDEVGGGGLGRDRGFLANPFIEFISIGNNKQQPGVHSGAQLSEHE